MDVTLTVPKVTLKTSPRLTPTGIRDLPLLRDIIFQVRVSLLGTHTVDSYAIERRRETGTTWNLIFASQRVTETQRLPGFFRARGATTIEGIRIHTTDVPYEVRFPTFTEIATNKAVRDATKAAWESTLAATTPTTRQEKGFWIILNTATGNYVFTPTVDGPLLGPDDRGSVDLSPSRPKEDGAVYTVASFHTHTPMTYLRNQPRKCRTVGPSPDDNELNKAHDVIGIVYDYKAVTRCPDGTLGIPGEHPLRAKALLYESGEFRLHRRRTPEL